MPHAAPGALLRRAAAGWNRVLLPVLTSGPGDRLLGGALTVLEYDGRRSGRRFRLPVGYRRTGDALTVRVGLPGRKTWWRNFLEPGGPVTVQLRGGQRTGRAVAHRGAKGQVTVRIDLDPL